MASRVRVLFVSVLLPFTFAAVSAQAGEFTLKLGGFYANTDSKIGVDNPLGGDLTLDLEEDLKLEEDQLLPFAELIYDFNDIHHVYFDWKRLHREATQESITKPYDFDFDGGDGSYRVQAGARVNTTLNIDIARVGYGYSFYQDKNIDLGVSAGLHMMFIEVGFSGQIGACVETSSGKVCDDGKFNQTVIKKVTAPLPDIGLFGSYSFDNGVSIGGHAQYFYLAVDELKGDLIDIRAGVDYRFYQDWSLSLAYNYYEVSVDWKRNNSNLDLSYNFHGPMMSVAYTF